MNQEHAYVDLLAELRALVESDNIPEDEKENLYYHIDELQEALWKYSV